MTRIEREKKTATYHLVSLLVSSAVAFTLTFLFIYIYCRLVYG